jgi:tripartite-type tricarboxylate transporter receptor subunit TctC
MSYFARRTFCMAFAQLPAALALGRLAPLRAQAKYPSRPVRIVVPFGAGGVADTTVRVVAEKLGDVMGQRFVIENQPGAGGIAAARAVLSAPADGHTLALLSNGTAVSVGLFKKLAFDPLKDFAPISSLGYFDFVLATGANSGFSAMADFLKAVRENPGSINVGTINIGSTQNLSAQLLKSAGSLDFAIVPFRTSPEVLVAVLRNDVALMIDNYAALKAALSDAQVRALASSGAARSPVLPDVPTVREAGIADYETTSWNALFVKAGTPPDIVAGLNSALAKVLAEPETKKQLLEFGIEGKSSTPDELGARLRGDIAKWSAVIERAGIPKQ